MIEEKINNNEKMTAKDMSNMQQDVLDVMARRQMPILAGLARQVKEELPTGLRSDLEEMLSILEKWDFEFDEESVGATVYTFAMLRFHKSLFHKYESDPEQRSMMIDGYL